MLVDMTKTWPLSRATSRQCFNHRRLFSFHIQSVETTSHKGRGYSVLLSPHKVCRPKHSLPLRNLLSSMRPMDPERHKGNKEMQVKTAAKIMKEKLKKDLETARNLPAHQVLNVPNFITAARILSTPYLAYLIVQGAHVSAIGLLAAAGVSDWLDGYIARTYHQESIVGSFLDPFADKLLVGTLSMSMMWSGLLPMPLAALILGRDALLIGDGGAFQVCPSTLSKVNTALQFSSFGLALTHAAWLIPTTPTLDVLFGVVGTTTVLSGVEYCYGYMTKTGAFRPLPKAVERPIRKAVERTEAVVKRTRDVIKRPLENAGRQAKERIKK